ncbi:MAG TPA: hypothetical protein VK463_06605 [Desulfomonilaceae bacterium]|nr:hypothetical protein [Desulfomonilaceae bacterium]
MKRKFIAAFKRNEIYVVATIIGVVFISAMGIVALLLKNSIMTPPYETLADTDLKSVFASGYLRHREDDGSPYLKVELHNGTLWWIKNVEFDFDGMRYNLRDSDAFRPLHFGAVRCGLKKAPPLSEHIDYDLKIVKASGYPPAQVQWERNSKKIAGGAKEPGSRN